MTDIDTDIASDPSVTRPAPPTQGAPVRRLLHTLVALVGWALFLWWWWIVLRHVDPGQVRFTGLFVGGTLVVCVLVTAAWSFHNLRIWKRRGARQQVPQVAYEFKRDRLGRPISFAEGRDPIEHAPVVQIRLEHEGKAYRAFDRLAPRRSAVYTVPVEQPAATVQHGIGKPAPAIGTLEMRRDDPEKPR